MSQTQDCLCQSIKRKKIIQLITDTSRVGKKKKWGVTLRWYRHGYICLSWSKRKSTSHTVICTYMMGAIFFPWTGVPRKLVEKQGLVTELESYATLFLYSGGILAQWIGSFEVGPAPDDPHNFRQVFLCGPILSAVKRKVTTVLLDSLPVKWSYCWASYLQEITASMLNC